MEKEKKAPPPAPIGSSEKQLINPLDLTRCSSPEARALVPYEAALRYQVLPLALLELRGERTVTVASADLSNDDLRALRFLTSCAIRPIRVGERELSESIFRSYRSSGAEQEHAVRRGDAPRLLSLLIEQGLGSEASDLHLIPQQESFELVLRRDGGLSRRRLEHYTASLHQELLNRVAFLANLGVRRPGEALDGSFTLELPHRSTLIRFHIFPTHWGEKLVLRLPQGVKLRPLPSLGLSSLVTDELHQLRLRRRGGVLVVGPTGSGKTSTLYSIISSFPAGSFQCVTVEDPVEAVLPFASQTEINPIRGLTYESCLQSVVRQDPDVIMLGEIREKQSARLMAEACLTGHIVLSTVHAGDCFEALRRLEMLGVPKEMIAEALRLVVALRLVPRVCSKCSVIDLLGSKQLGFRVVRAVGCADCDHSGYRGSVLLEQSLRVSPKLELSSRREEMVQNVTPSVYQPWEEAVQRHVRAGALDLKTALQCMDKV